MFEILTDFLNFTFLCNKIILDFDRLLSQQLYGKNNHD